MRRFKQSLSIEECIDLLDKQTRGVLSMIGDNGYPYGVPMNHYYSKEENILYFHGAKQGHKIDSISRNNKVCYTVYDSGYRKDDDWALNVKSVVVFGKVNFIDDINKSKYICEKLCRKFTNDEDYIKYELEHSLKHVQCLKLKIEHISGKLVNEK